MNSDFEQNRHLVEQKDVRQHEGEPFRKIFFSKLIQIDFWYTDNTSHSIYGTQITLNDREVITAIEGKPLSYTASDEDFYINQTAILRANGIADKNLIDLILMPLIDQLPQMECEYVQTLIEEIRRDNYVRYPII